MDIFVTPYRLCVSIFIKVYCAQRTQLSPKENGKICLLLLEVIRQNEFSFRELIEMIESRCDSIIAGQFRKVMNETIIDINNLFELVKQMRDCPNVENYSVSGLFLRKITIYFDRLTHQACSRLYDDLIAYVANTSVRRRGHSVAWATPRTTRSSNITVDTSQITNKPVKQIYQVNQEILRLQANEQRALNPKELHESLRRPTNSCKSDATFLRYLNLMRVNESVGSKHLLLAYFDMVSDSVSRSYSPLNYAILYLHHGEYKRAIECLQECYCCAQAADDDKCLLIALMWLARILIQAKQKNSTKYNVRALLELVRKRSHKSHMPYVQAMSSMTLEQLNGPVDDSEMLKKSTETLKQVAQNNRQPNHLLLGSNQPNPLDKEDALPSAEVLAVRNSMNDVLAMYYALLSAHLSLKDANQSSALASQVLLHFDLIEKCGDEDVFLMNENTFIAVRNLTHHVWNSLSDINLVREILVDVCSVNIPQHRTDNHSIWRQALSEISFEYYMEQENWCEATKMISIIEETDLDGAQLRQAELLQMMGSYDEALEQVDELIQRIEMEASNLTDPIESSTSEMVDRDGFESSSSEERPLQDSTKHDVSLGEGRARQQRPLDTEKGQVKQQKQGNSSELLDARLLNPHDDKRSKNSYPIHPSLSIEHKSFIKSKALLLRAILLDDETQLLESLQYASENNFLHVRTSCLMQLACRWSDRVDKIIDPLVVEVLANGTRKEKQQLRRLVQVH